jgi:hypothetical protein
MDFEFYIGGFTLDITVPGNPFHHKPDTVINFGTGLHAFVLNFNLFNQPIQKPEFDLLNFEPSFDFDFTRPVCTIGQFFFEGGCSDCAEGIKVCTDANTPALTCHDSECSSCDDNTQGSACNDCGLNGKAKLLNGICECIEGYERADINTPCHLGGSLCTLGDAVGRCNRCENDTGLWYGDCLSCSDGFFLQPNSRTCTNYCPSGTFAPLENRCGDFEFPLVLDVTFDLIGEIQIPSGFGSIDLPGGDFNPTAIFDRGFYFNGIGNRLDITGVVINSSFTIITWIKET